MTTSLYWESAPDPDGDHEETEEERRKRFDRNMENAVHAMLVWAEEVSKSNAQLSRALSGKDEYGTPDYNPDNPLAKIADKLGDIVNMLGGYGGTSPFQGIETAISEISEAANSAKTAMDKTLGNAALDALRSENQRLTHLLFQVLGKDLERSDEPFMTALRRAMREAEESPAQSESPPDQTD